MESSQFDIKFNLKFKVIEKMVTDFITLIIHADSLPGRIEMAWPNLMNEGPSSVNFSLS